MADLLLLFPIGVASFLEKAQPVGDFANTCMACFNTTHVDGLTYHFRFNSKYPYTPRPSGKLLTSIATAI
ncbi:MAG: hypothetical protein LBL59_04365 [Xanthomonadaceae bacterium]|nr:hypothetical protein [Xanthomonadaceae bacterium]